MDRRKKERKNRFIALQLFVGVKRPNVCSNKTIHGLLEDQLACRTCLLITRIATSNTCCWMRQNGDQSSAIWNHFGLYENFMEILKRWWNDVLLWRILMDHCQGFYIVIQPYLMGRDGSVGIATRYGLGGPGIELYKRSGNKETCRS